MPRPLYRRPTRGAPGSSPVPDDAATRALRAHYRTPDDPAYWDGLEARIMSAVRDGATRATRATQPAVEWWHALARWSRPGLAAAALLLVATGALAARGGDAAGSPFRRLLGAPPATPLLPHDPDLARLIDGGPGDAAAAEAREIGDLLGEGLDRRRAVRLDTVDVAPGEAGVAGEPGVTALPGARRDAVPRPLGPEE